MAYDYTSYINAANKSYEDTIKGYQDTLTGLQSKQDELMGKYNTLQGDVLEGLEGSDRSQRDAIRERYEQEYGKMQSGLASKGLGSTTVGANLQRGLISDRTKAENELTDRFAQLSAGYRSNLGLAGLSYAGQALGAQQALNQAQLGYMGGWGSQQAALGAQYAGIANQERGQDIGMTMQREQMAQQMRMAQQENATRMSVAGMQAWGGGGGGGGGGVSGRSDNSGIARTVSYGGGGGYNDYLSSHGGLYPQDVAAMYAGDRAAMHEYGANQRAWLPYAAAGYTWGSVPSTYSDGGGGLFGDGGGGLLGYAQGY